MNPLDHFEFSQSSLQDYVDCRRRFQLRYLERVAWPAVQAEPVRENEQHIQRGDRFHRLAQQYLLGIPEEKLTRMAASDPDENLLAWWNNFLAEIPPQLAGQRHVEVTLSAPLLGFRLVAKYDLILVRPDGKAVIYDWKTALRRPRRSRLLERLQTRVYPFLLAQSGALLNNGVAFTPDQIEMRYWFSEPGQAAEVIAYSSRSFQDDGIYLNSLVTELESLKREQYTLTEDEKNCQFCVYRSLCDRGVQAGSLGQGDDPENEPDQPDGLDFNLEQIGEISF